MEDKENKHYKRAKEILEPKEKEEYKSFNRTQRFFLQLFEKDLSDKDFNEVKQVLKLYFVEKLQNSFIDKKPE